MVNGRYILNADQLLVRNSGSALASGSLSFGAPLRMAKGSVAGISGAEGSGKSALLQCIFGTCSLPGCEVSVNGVRLTHAYTVFGLVNYLPQVSFMPAQFTVRKVLALYAVPEDQVFDIFPELANEAGRLICDLSGGMERLLSVLVILLAGTRFSLLDAPFTGIVPMYLPRLYLQIQSARQAKGILLTACHTADLLPVCDSIYRLQDGHCDLIHHATSP